MDRKSIINKAAIYAPVFAIISIAYMALGIVVPQGKIAWSAVTFIVWLIKFVGIIWLMLWCMRKLKASSSESLSRREVACLGNYIALFSSIVVAAFSYISVEYINPEAFDEALSQFAEAMHKSLDANSRSALEWLSENFATMSFFSNFIYCWLCGVILSAICSTKVISDNPFQNNGTDEQ